MAKLSEEKLMEPVHSFNRDYNKRGVRDLKKGIEDIIKFCKRGLKNHCYVMGSERIFFVLIDEESQRWYSDNQNWSHVIHGTILLMNIFKINCDVIHEVLRVMVIVDCQGYDHNFLYYDEDGITQCETFKDYLMEYGCSLFDHKSTRQPDKDIVAIFICIMEDHSGKSWLRKIWEYRFFSTMEPVEEYWKKFIKYASIANDRLRNVIHVHEPMVRFSRRILFVQGNQNRAILKEKTIKISYRSQQAYNDSMNVAVDHLYKIGKEQDKKTLEKRHADLSSLLSEEEQEEGESEDNGSLLSSEEEENQSTKNKNYKDRKHKRKKRNDKKEEDELSSEEEEKDEQQVSDNDGQDDESYSNDNNTMNHGNDGDSIIEELNNNINDNNSNSTRKKGKRTIFEIGDGDKTVSSPVSIINNDEFTSFVVNGHKRRKLIQSEHEELVHYIEDPFYNPRIPNKKRLTLTSSVCFICITKKNYNFIIFLETKSNFFFSFLVC